MSNTRHVLATGDFLQDWSNTGLITGSDDWGNVPGIIGYLGDVDGGSPTNVDPQTRTADALGAPDVITNQTDTTINNGGVAEFHGANPTVALQGSGTADAPSLVLYMDATGRSNVRLKFDARDIDGTAEDAVQQIAVQYRLASSGTWTNLPAGYIADASTGGSATQVTPVDFILPAAVNGAAHLEIRILTTNAGGSDEWIGIDNIQVSSEPVGDAPQTVGFAADSLSVSEPEGNAGVTEITFTVERDGGTTGEVSFAGTVTPGDTDDADYVGGEVPVFAGVIPEGEQSVTVTIEVAGDAGFEPDESFTLTLTDVVNSEDVPTSVDAAADTATGTIINDDTPPLPEFGGIKILEMAESLEGSVATPVAVADPEIAVTRRGSWDSGDGEGGAESISFDKSNARAYVTNAKDDTVDILDLSNPFAPVKLGEIDLTTLPNYGNVNSVAVRNGLIAVAVQNADGGEPGLVALYDAAGTLIKTITVGVLPDQLTFSPDGNLLLVANEGERFLDRSGPTPVVENAPGTVTVIDVSGAPADAAVRNTIGFSALDAFEAELDALGIKTYDGGASFSGGTITVGDSTVSQDIEPEYVAVSPDGTKAYVTLQEVNAVAVIDLTNTSADKPISILPLGYVDFSLPGNQGDFSDQDTAGNNNPSLSVGNGPIKSLLQPDAIASFDVNGTTYFITANEGDSRILSDATLGDPALNEARASSLTNPDDDDYARLNVDTVWSSPTDLYAFGGRGFSIFQQNPDGTVVKVEETGGDFEQIIAALPNAGTVFNGQNGGEFDSRSDNKAAEPEGVAVGEVGGVPYAFVALERIGGIMVWDLSTPSDAKFVKYIAPTSQDYGPEVVKFVSAEDSPTGRAFVMTANEISGTVTTYDLEEAGITKVSAIQGTGAASTMVGQTVTIEAIVVGDFQNGDADGKRNLGGFYVQEEIFDADGNPLTSEGIFVFGGSTNVNVGDRVRITATVSENFGQTQLNTPTITVIEAGAVADVESMAAIIDLPSVGATLNQNGQYQPDLEAYEGMLVTIPETLTITEQFNLDRFNEVKLVAGDRPAQFTHENDPDQAGYQAHLQEIGSRTITYDDGSNSQNLPIGNLDGFGPTYDTATAPRMGDTVRGLTGVLDYQWAGASASGSTWRVRSVEDGANSFEGGAPRQAEPEDVGGRLQVGSFNLLNYFKTLNTINEPTSGPDNPADNTEIGLDPRGANNATEFARQTEKLVEALATLDADVLALIEIENDFLVGSSGNAIAYLVEALNAEVGAGTYAWVDPGQQFVGGDAIAVGYIYKPSMVRVNMETTIEILDDSDLPGLGLQGLIDNSTVDAVFNGLNTSRAALAVTFEEVSTGYDFTAVANHLKSKSGTGTGNDADQLDGQGNWQQQREYAATALTQWVASDPTGSNDSDILLLGDFNAYFKEDTIDIIKAAGFENLQEQLSNPYSYVFDGQVGALDYIFANGSLADQVTGVTEWHINSDEADALDYNTDFGRDPAIFDPNSPVRVSDHDPLLIGLNLTEEAVAPAFTLQLLHFADAESGLLASQTAHNLAAMVDAFEDDYAHTLVLAGGDNFIPGPFLAAGTDPSVADELNALTGSTIAPGSVPMAAVDIALHNLIGVEASAIGNHDFDLGSNVLATALGGGSGWGGAQFVSVSANLVIGPNSPYYTNPTATDAPLNALYVDTLDFSAQTPGANPTTTLIPEASTLKKKIVPATVITEGTEKIGIVGATTQILESISSPTGAEIAGFPGGAGANGEVDNMALLAAQLQPVIDEMIAEGINKIILMSHLQVIANEKQLATLLKGVDIILSAGSNTRLGDADDEAVAFPGHSADFADTYPLVIENAEGKSTLIVNTDNEFTYLGRLVVDFDANGDLILDSLSENQAINGAYASTEENVAEAWETTVDNLENTAFADGTKGDNVRTLTGAVQDVIDEKDGNVYGYSNVYLEGERIFVRSEETNLGNLTADANAEPLTDALRNALGAEAETTYVVSLKNGGGIRAQIGTLSAPDPVDGTVDKLPPEGGVSQLDVENALRFNNKLIAFDTTAAGLKAIIETGLIGYPNQGRMPQIGGMAFSFDPAAPNGSKVMDLALIDADGNTLVRLYDDGVLLPEVPGKITMATLNFLADDGDGYVMKANGENFRYLLEDGSLGPALPEGQSFVANAPANALGEQKALEDFLREHHGTPETAYDEADTPKSLDERIQNLTARADTVLEAVAENFIGNGDDNVFDGGALNDTANGNNGDDVLDGHGGDDRLRGGNGDDILVGGTGEDDLTGGADDDTLFGGEQNDVLEGGAGDDVLAGGDGSDEYAYEAGDGSDTITEAAGVSGDSDVLLFTDIASDEVTMVRHGDDVEILLADGSSVTLEDQFAGTGGVEQVVFADGETLDRTGIIAGLENRAPTADNDTLASVAEDAASFLIPFGPLLDGDMDPDLDVLAVTAAGDAVGGTAVWQANGILFTPTPNFNGQASFKYTVSDGRGGTAQATASFAITSVEDLPVVTSPINVTLAEDTSANGTIVASDGDGDTLTYTVKSGAGPAHGEVTLDAAGNWIYTADGDYNGTDSFVVVVSDGDDTAEATVNLTVTPVNDGPDVTDPAPVSTNEDTQVSGQIVADDVDEDALTYTVKSGSGPAHGSVVLNAGTGTWTYMPIANYHGADSFVVVVSDGTVEVETTVDIAIASVNDAPVATDDAGSAGENEVKLFDLIGNDTDVEDGQPILVGVQVTDVDGISLSNSQAQGAFAIENGQLKFSPGTRFDALDDGQNATVTLSYTVQDSAGAQSTAEFVLTVEGESDANIITGGNGTNILFGTNGVDIIDARGGADVVFGRDGDDIIDGGNGNDILFGGDDDDTIDGGAGRDTIFGGRGADMISGGAGNDLLTGEGGADVFQFRPGYGDDTVLDFSGSDLIELDAAVFADFAALQANSGALVNTGFGAQINYDDGSSLTLVGVNAGSLNADDFRFV